MKNFFSRIIERHQGLTNNVFPRKQSRFESHSGPVIHAPGTYHTEEYVSSGDTFNDREIGNNYTMSEMNPQVKSDLLTKTKSLEKVTKKIDKQGKTVNKEITEDVIIRKDDGISNKEIKNVQEFPETDIISKRRKHIESQNIEVPQIKQMTKSPSKKEITEKEVYASGIQNHKGISTSSENDMISFESINDNPFSNGEIIHDSKTENIFNTRIIKNESGKNGILNTNYLHEGQKLEKEIFIKQASIPETTVKINIGRIEVKAVHKPERQNLQPKAITNPKLTLEDYLKQRNGGKR